MALHEKSKSQGIFFSLKHGGFALEADGPTEGYTEMEVNNPSTGKMVTKWIKKYESIEGKIGKLEWYDREHGGTRYMGLKIIIRDAGESYSIDLVYGKRHWNYFMRVMDNIDYTQPVELVAYPKKDDKGRPYTEFAVKQNGGWVEQSYTRKDPGECPVAVQDQMGNWDSRDRQAWLYDRLVNVIIPYVTELNDTGDADEPAYDDEAEAPAFTGPAQPQAPQAPQQPLPPQQLATGAVGGSTGPDDEATYREATEFNLDEPPQYDDGFDSGPTAAPPPERFVPQAPPPPAAPQPPPPEPPVKLTPSAPPPSQGQTAPASPGGGTPPGQYTTEKPAMGGVGPDMKAASPPQLYALTRIAASHGMTIEQMIEAQGWTDVSKPEQLSSKAVVHLIATYPLKAKD